MNNKIIKAIEKAKKDFPEEMIYGVFYYPATSDNDEEIVIYGGVSSEKWKTALHETDRRSGINHCQLAVYKVLE